MGGIAGGFLWARSARTQHAFEAAWAKPMDTVTADALCGAYEANPIPFEKIKGVAVAVVTGTVNNIDVHPMLTAVEKCSARQSKSAALGLG